MSLNFLGCAGRKKKSSLSQPRTLKVCSIALILLKMKSGVIVVIIEFTYLHHTEQPLAHSSVSSYQSLYHQLQTKYIHVRAACQPAGAQQLGQITAIKVAFQIQEQAAKAHGYTRSELSPAPPLAPLSSQTTTKHIL